MSIYLANNEYDCDDSDEEKNSCTDHESDGVAENLEYEAIDNDDEFGEFESSLPVDSTIINMSETEVSSSSFGAPTEQVGSTSSAAIATSPSAVIKTVRIPPLSDRTT